MADTINDQDIRLVYEWVDEFEFSKQKKNITRDFADGLLIAEIIHSYYPHLVEVHNYYNTNNQSKKQENWNLLKKKVFKKIDFHPSQDQIEAIINCKAFAIELFLLELRDHLEQTSVEKPLLNNHLYEQAKKKSAKRPKDRSKSPIGKKKQQDGQTQKNQVLIEELQYKVEMLEGKIEKMNQIILVKDEKIRLLEGKISELTTEQFQSFIIE